MRSEILENTCKALGSLVIPDVVKSVSERVRADMACEETKESQDKVNGPEGATPVEAVADTEESSPVVVSTDTAVADQEDYKLIAEKAKAENSVLREEIKSLHEAMRFIQILSRPDSQSKTPKVTGSIQ